MKNIEGVFIDFYGTLVGGDGQAVEAICQSVLDDYGIAEMSGAELSQLWGRAYFAAIESCNHDHFRSLTEIERDTLIETVEPLVGAFDAMRYIEQLNAFLAKPLLFEEVHEVLGGLDLPVCVVSNADEHQLRPALTHHKIHVTHVVTSEAARSYKPDVGIFRYALELTGWSADRVIHVGDSLHSDIEGAQRVGIATAWVRREGRISDIGQALPDHTWDDLRPLSELGSAVA